jgi:hypothetical protein
VSRATAARAVAVATVLLVVLSGGLLVVLHLDASYQPAESLPSSLLDTLIPLSFAAVGAVVTVKRPDNRVGWALSLSGLAQLAGGVCGGYAELALLAKPEAGLPAGAAAGAISDGSWTPIIAGIFLLILLFPQGRLPSSRWRAVAWLVLVGLAAIWFLIATSPGHLGAPLKAYENPLAFASSKSYVVAVFPIIGICFVGTGLAGINLLLRFWRSRGVERQQFKWLAASAAFFVAMAPVALAFNYSGAVGAVFAVALIALPVSVGIAVLRYRLYEIDVIVRRTLVYGVLSGGLAALYFGIVLALQLVFSSVAGGSDLAIAGSTLAVAALFRPARRRVQAFVDRRFYRHKYDAERTLAAFAARLRDEIDLEALRAELTTVVAETMKPAHVSLWLRGRAVRDARSR